MKKSTFLNTSEKKKAFWELMDIFTTEIARRDFKKELTPEQARKVSEGVVKKMKSL